MSPESVEPSQRCILVNITPESKGVGDGSGSKPKYVVVCEEVKNIQ